MRQPPVPNRLVEVPPDIYKFMERIVENTPNAALHDYQRLVILAYSRGYRDGRMGRGTCKVVSKPCDMWECECGKAWWHGGAPNYCPSCGREVVVS